MPDKKKDKVDVRDLKPNKDAKGGGGVVHAAGSGGTRHAAGSGGPRRAAGSGGPGRNQ
jgi:hypothetical protein